jgi:hypothetical protein
VTDTATVYRLLGVHHNRLVTVIDSDKHTSDQISPATAEILKAHGWTRYAGPARTERGWVIPGTDPNLRPRPLKVS